MRSRAPQPIALSRAFADGSAEDWSGRWSVVSNLPGYLRQMLAGGERGRGQPVVTAIRVRLSNGGLAVVKPRGGRDA